MIFKITPFLFAALLSAHVAHAQETVRARYEKLLGETLTYLGDSYLSTEKRALRYLELGDRKQSLNEDHFLFMLTAAEVTGTLAGHQSRINTTDTQDSETLLGFAAALLDNIEKAEKNLDYCLVFVSIDSEADSSEIQSLIEISSFSKRQLLEYKVRCYKIINDLRPDLVATLKKNLSKTDED